MTWIMVRLGDVARVDAKTIQPELIPEDVPYVGLESIGRRGEVDESITAGASNLMSAKNSYNSRHILFGKLRPNLGKVARPEKAGVSSTDIYPLLPSERVDRDYLAQFLLTPEAIAYSTGRTTGVNLPRVSWPALSELRMPLPPLPEQRRIAAILDKADALRTTQLRAVHACTVLAEAAFRELEGSLDDKRTMQLDDIAIVASGITKGRKAPTGPLSSVDYMTVANVQDKRLDLSLVKQIEVSAVELERYRLRRGDLLLTEGGDPDKLGRGVVWNEELTDAIHQNHVFRVRLRDPALSPVWLNWEVGSPYGKRYFLRMAKQTTGIATINSTQIRAFPVRIPDAGAVERFFASLENVERARVAAEARSLLLESLFASLQHRAFRGEL